MVAETEALPVPKGRKKHRRRWRKQLSRQVQYLALRVGHAVVSRLPLPLGRALAWTVGTATYLLLRHERAIALHNLTCAFGDSKSERERRRIARASFQSTAQTFIEWIIIRRWSEQRVARKFSGLVEAAQKMRSRAGPRGVVGYTYHLGNWEVLSFVYGHANPDFLVSVAKPTKFPKTQAFLHALRSTPGASLYYTDETPRKMIRALRDGRLLGFLPDQDLRTNKGIFVDFFGRPAYSVTLPASLARKEKAQYFSCALVREGKGFRYLEVGPEEFPWSDSEEDDVRAITERWTGHLEEMIREYPEQWIWYYPRWRTKPERARKHFKRGRSS